ncbi:ubiquitin-protein ligase RKR1 [Aspergillus clavatus NRRL 1]|uniref:E3 ubiquitin-protein ligase listerin n=1 Tax=Aspergillus clavatus (strain ATCC 1007 / CBS 513.65 / DSM 816 / NCTC 3887 / NRRL 1 / QM 1276 / 107) TaxID=344612 RepID=A1CP69_ASPCL|nr:RING zinc finger protein, putative [Aspergillus clavatus NRRL 1]EAW07440.1 RING zinc finger protein, putative [Aspergillus clavatus NRRL 1]
MSKKFKSQASSSRAAASAFGSFGGFSSAFSSPGRAPSSLTYVTEPPDLSRIADAQLAISFKNFLKKDEVTRIRSLDEIKDFVSKVESRGGTLDEGFLDAWIKIYPRASIDLSRRVRQTAHSVQGSIAYLIGKRIAPFLPKVVGAWLAGVYDNDRPVHLSALESFTRVFSTDQKRSGVWKVYQSSILEFVDDVILQQTPQTLSDERTVKPDDAEAKYARVVGTALMLFNRILANSTHEDLQKDLSTVETLLQSKTLWSLCFHDDPFVRKSVYVLLRSAVSKEPEELDWKILSAALIGKSLSTPQLGSGSELSETLLQVTSARPQLWTEDYSGKTTSSKRLLQYIQKGSQGGTASFWANLSQLLQILPSEVLARADPQAPGEGNIGLSSSISLSEAFQAGLNSREEPRQNHPAGWKSYVETGIWLAHSLPEIDRDKFLCARLSPLVLQYVRVEQDVPQWSLPVQAAEAICTEYILALAKYLYEGEVRRLWTDLTDGLLEAVKLSAPEQSKEFRSSQDAVCARSGRLFALEASVLASVADSDCRALLSRVFEETNLPLLDGCLQVLQSRNGKPYAAAAVVEEMIRNVADIARQSRDLPEFVQNEASNLLASPSADRLISIILSCRSWDGFGSSFEKVVERVADSDLQQSNVQAVQKLLSTLDFAEVRDNKGLDSLIKQALDQACRGSRFHWPIVIAALQNQSTQGELVDSIFLSIINTLSDKNKLSDALFGLSQIADSVPDAIRGFQSGAYGSKLAAKLLFLTESSDEEVASLAESLIVRLKEIAIGETSAKSSVEILQHNFDHVNAESLSLGSLLSIAEDLLQAVDFEDIGSIAKDILPSRQSWERAIQPFLDLPPRSSTAITNPLGGTLYLVHRDLSDTFKEQYRSIPRDAGNCSSAFRLAYFTVRILSSFDIVSKLSAVELETIAYFMPLVVQLIDDDLSIENCNGITGLSHSDQRDEYMELVHDGRKMISQWARSEIQSFGTEESISSIILSFWQGRLEALGSTSPADYRIGEAFVKLMNSVDSPGRNKSPEDITKLCREMRTANAIKSAAWVAVLRDSILTSPTGIRLCNELVADSTGLKPQDEKKDGIRKLSILNLLLAGEVDVAGTFPTQRLVFLVKHLVRCLQSEELPLSLKAEIIRTLTFVLPHLNEIYGSHWEDCIDVLCAIWHEVNGGDDALPLILSSFRLFAALRSIVADEDSNDEVKDVWSERKTELFNNLVSTLGKLDHSTTFHQPRDITAEVLCRLIEVIPAESLEDVNKMFYLLTANSRAVQKAAYTLLHRYIPSTQEQVSFDVALSNSVARLPDELMSLLLEAPTKESIALAEDDDRTWTGIRSYLLSWNVVFDHFVNASLTVQEQYVSGIKENDSLGPLLEFMFDLLQQSQGKLVDASKFDIRSFELDESETHEKEIQWLLVHLYFLCLKHLGNLTKSWWLDTTNRIKGPVEAWSEKFVSPLIIEDSLKGVDEWIATQDPNEERALSVKIAPRTAEIIASIPVDEDSPPVAISISLPPAYPLQPALVVGRSRVLVDERKWRSWLLTIQGVIMFSNGNLVDGLMAFRKNVQGALKGQSECAICYSVISTDMQTPNKRCATCKNTFHSVCLFRWFKSSNQSTCPLCRNNFVYV